MLNRVLSTIARAKTIYNHVRATMGYESTKSYAAAFTIAKTTERLTSLQRLQHATRHHQAFLFLREDEKACTLFLMKTNGYHNDSIPREKVLEEAAVMMGARQAAMMILASEYPYRRVRELATKSAERLAEFAIDPRPGRLATVASDTEVLEAISYHTLYVA